MSLFLFLVVSIDAATCEYSYTSLQKILIHWIRGCSPRLCWKVRKDTVYALPSFAKIGKIFNSKNPKASGFQKRICRSLVAGSQGGWGLNVEPRGKLLCVEHMASTRRCSREDCGCTLVAPSSPAPPSLPQVSPPSSGPLGTLPSPQPQYLL